MIEKIARRAGGFASTTAFGWLGAARDAAADTAPVQPTNGTHRRKPLVAGAVAVVAAVVSSKPVRSTAERTLRGIARKVRSETGNGSHTSGTNGAVADLAGKTKVELYELAKKADVPGRSSMSKEDLTNALTS